MSSSNGQRKEAPGKYRKGLKGLCDASLRYSLTINRIAFTQDSLRRSGSGEEQPSSFRQQQQQQQQSTFRSSLRNLTVPIDLLKGVECLRVFANGQTQQSYLTLSPDRFTLYLTTERKRPRKSSSFVQFLFKQSSNGDSSGGGTSGGTTTTTSGTQYMERAIDIGAIARIQRGHGSKRFVQATWVFPSPPFWGFVFVFYLVCESGVFAVIIRMVPLTFCLFFFLPSDHCRRRLSYSNWKKRKLHRQDAMHSLLSATGDESIMTTSAMLNPSHCFSILFRGDWTLDLMMVPWTSVINNRTVSMDRDTILDALDHILETYQRQKRLVSNDVLLLRHHWMDAVSDKVCIYNQHTLSLF